MKMTEMTKTKDVNRETNKQAERGQSAGRNLIGKFAVLLIVTFVALMAMSNDGFAGIASAAQETSLAGDNALPQATVSPIYVPSRPQNAVYDLYFYEDFDDTFRNSGVWNVDTGVNWKIQHIAESGSGTGGDDVLFLQQQDKTDHSALVWSDKDEVFPNSGDMFIVFATRGVPPTVWSKIGYGNDPLNITAWPVEYDINDDGVPISRGNITRLQDDNAKAGSACHECYYNNGVGLNANNMEWIIPWGPCYYMTERWVDTNGDGIADTEFANTVYYDGECTGNYGAHPGGPSNPYWRGYDGDDTFYILTQHINKWMFVSTLGEWERGWARYAGILYGQSTNRYSSDAYWWGTAPDGKKDARFSDVWALYSIHFEEERDLGSGLTRLPSAYYNMAILYGGGTTTVVTPTRNAITAYDDDGGGEPTLYDTERPPFDEYWRFAATGVDISNEDTTPVDWTGYDFQAADNGAGSAYDRKFNVTATVQSGATINFGNSTYTGPLYQVGDFIKDTSASWGVSGKLVYYTTLHPYNGKRRPQSILIGLPLKKTDSAYNKKDGFWIEPQVDYVAVFRVYDDDWDGARGDFAVTYADRYSPFSPIAGSNVDIARSLAGDNDNNDGTDCDGAFYVTDATGRRVEISPCSTDDDSMPILFPGQTYTFSVVIGPPTGEQPDWATRDPQRSNDQAYAVYMDWDDRGGDTPVRVSAATKVSQNIYTFTVQIPPQEELHWINNGQYTLAKVPYRIQVGLTPGSIVDQHEFEPSSGPQFYSAFGAEDYNRPVRYGEVTGGYLCIHPFVEYDFGDAAGEAGADMTAAAVYHRTPNGSTGTYAGWAMLGDNEDFETSADWEDEYDDGVEVMVSPNVFVPADDYYLSEGADHLILRTHIRAGDYAPTQLLRARVLYDADGKGGDVASCQGVGWSITPFGPWFDACTETGVYLGKDTDDTIYFRVPLPLTLQNGDEVWIETIAALGSIFDRLPTTDFAYYTGSGEIETYRFVVHPAADFSDDLTWTSSLGDSAAQMGTILATRPPFETNAMIGDSVDIESSAYENDNEVDEADEDGVTVQYDSIVNPTEVLELDAQTLYGHKVSEFIPSHTSMHAEIEVQNAEYAAICFKDVGGDAVYADLSDVIPLSGDGTLSHTFYVNDNPGLAYLRIVVSAQDIAATTNANDICGEGMHVIPNGEVEDYIIAKYAKDYGDAGLNTLAGWDIGNSFAQIIDLARTPYSGNDISTEGAARTLDTYNDLGYAQGSGNYHVSIAPSRLRSLEYNGRSYPTFVLPVYDPQGQGYSEHLFVPVHSREATNFYLWHDRGRSAVNSDIVLEAVGEDVSPSPIPPANEVEWGSVEATFTPSINPLDADDYDAPEVLELYRLETMNAEDPYGNVQRISSPSDSFYDGEIVDIPVAYEVLPYEASDDPGAYSNVLTTTLIRAALSPEVYLGNDWSGAYIEASQPIATSTDEDDGLYVWRTQTVTYGAIAVEIGHSYAYSIAIRYEDSPWHLEGTAYDTHPASIYLGLWVDWDGRGDAHSPDGGVVTLPWGQTEYRGTLQVPAWLNGRTYVPLRVYLSTTPLNAPNDFINEPTGFGEIEDYLLYIQPPPLDYTDDTTYYATSMSNGYMRVVTDTTGVWLGAGVSIEDEPRIEDTMDDGVQVNGDDGSTNIVPLFIGVDNEVSLHYHTGSSGGHLALWIDGNGSADGGIEAALSDGVVGANEDGTLNVIIPASVTASWQEGAGYLRAYIGKVRAPSYDPEMDSYDESGEVEDYAVEIIQPKRDYSDGTVTSQAQTLTPAYVMYATTGWQWWLGNDTDAAGVVAQAENEDNDTSEPVNDAYDNGLRIYASDGVTPLYDGKTLRDFTFIAGKTYELRAIVCQDEGESYATYGDTKGATVMWHVEWGDGSTANGSVALAAGSGGCRSVGLGSVTAPDTTDPSAVFLRLYVTNAQNPQINGTYSGVGVSGEIEDYVFNAIGNNPVVDLGDASLYYLVRVNNKRVWSNDEGAMGYAHVAAVYPYGTVIRDPVQTWMGISPAADVDIYIISPTVTGGITVAQPYSPTYTHPYYAAITGIQCYDLASGSWGACESDGAGSDDMTLRLVDGARAVVTSTVEGQWDYNYPADRNSTWDNSLIASGNIDSIPKSDYLWIVPMAMNGVDVTLQPSDMALALYSDRVRPGLYRITFNLYMESYWADFDYTYRWVIQNAELVISIDYPAPERSNE